MCIICEDLCQTHEVHYSPVRICSLICLGGRDIHTLREAHRGAPEPPEALRHRAVWCTCRERAEWWDTFNQSGHSTWPSSALPVALTWPAGVDPVRPGWTWRAVAGGQERTQSLLERCHLCGSTASNCGTDRKPWKYSRWSNLTLQHSPGPNVQIHSAGFPLWFYFPGVFRILVSLSRFHTDK